MNHNKTRKKYFSISFSHIGLYLSRYLPKFCYARIFFLSKHVCCARTVIASNQIRAFDAALKPIRKRKKQKRHSACQFCRYFIIDEISNSLETYILNFVNAKLIFRYIGSTCFATTDARCVGNWRTFFREFSLILQMPSFFIRLHSEALQLHIKRHFTNRIASHPLETQQMIPTFDPRCHRDRRIRYTRGCGDYAIHSW